LAAAQKAELVVQRGHIDHLEIAVFSVDGHLVVTGGGRKSVKLWDVKTGKLLRSFNASADLADYDEFFEPRYSIAISQDNRFLAVWFGTEDDMIVWRIADGKVVRRLNIGSDLDHVLAFTAKSDILADLSSPQPGERQRGLILWNVFTGKRVKALNTQNYVGLFPAGRRLSATISETSDSIELRDLPTGKVVFSHQSSNVLRDGLSLTSRITDPMVVSADGSRVALIFGDGTIEVFNVASGAIVVTLPALPALPVNCDLTSDGRRLVCLFEDESLRTWEDANGPSYRLLTPPTPGFEPGQAEPDPTVVEERILQTLKISPDDSTAVVGAPYEMPKFVDLADPAKAREPKSASREILALHLNRDQQSLVFAFGNSISKWDLSGARTTEISETPFSVGDSYEPAFSYSPDGRYLFTHNAVTDKAVTEIWDVSAARRLPVILPLCEVVFSPDGGVAASLTVVKEPNAKFTLSLWDLRSDSLLWSRDIAVGDPARLSSDLMFTNAGGLYLGTTEIDLVDGKPRSTANVVGPDQIYMTGDGDKRPTGNSVVKLGDYTDFGMGVCATRFVAIATNRSFDRPVCDVAFTDDDKLIMGRTEQGEIKILNNNGGDVITMIPLGESDWVVTTPDGRFDTNMELDRIDGLHWVMSNDPLTPKPLEIFMRQYYEPDLLRRTLDCTRLGTCSKEFKTLPSISNLNRAQPALREPLARSPLQNR
jgi:WD40 repeat protein